MRGFFTVVTLLGLRRPASLYLSRGLDGYSNLARCRLPIDVAFFPLFEISQDLGETLFGSLIGFFELDNVHGPRGKGRVGSRLDEFVGRHPAGSPAADDDDVVNFTALYDLHRRPLALAVRRRPVQVLVMSAAVEYGDEGSAFESELFDHADLGAVIAFDGERLELVEKHAAFLQKSDLRRRLQTRKGLEPGAKPVLPGRGNPRSASSRYIGGRLLSWRPAWSSRG